MPAPTVHGYRRDNNKLNHRVHKPKPVPRGFGGANPTIPRTYDITPDGQILAVGTPSRAKVDSCRGRSASWRTGSRN